jgi:nitrate/TMAO reductase-like tetraheme cytochrome c subunit
LLKDKKVDSSVRWNHVDRMLRHEKRYNVITKISDKKKLFNEFIAMNKRAERTLAREKLVKARNEFLEMLKDFENLTSDSKWSYCVQYFYMDPRY